jgi:hypothetical protein
MQLFAISGVYDHRLNNQCKLRTQFHHTTIQRPLKILPETINSK